LWNFLLFVLFILNEENRGFPLQGGFLNVAAEIEDVLEVVEDAAEGRRRAWTFFKRP
jgi:hypothetical protein